MHKLTSKAKLLVQDSILVVAACEIDPTFYEVANKKNHITEPACLGSFDKVETTVMQELYNAYQKLSKACNDTKSNGMEFSCM